jgi:ABC-type multidrug transport system permease subunit
LDLRNEREKDGKQFFREGRTLLLLFAAPLLVLLVLGGVFGKTAAETSGIGMGLCDLDNSTMSHLFVSGISNSTKISDYSNTSECDAAVAREVTEGRLPAAIVIPKGFQPNIERGISQNMTVYIDNSRIQTAPSIEAFMKAAVQETGQKVGTQFILSVWGKLDNAATQLNTLQVRVNGSRADALRMKQRLQGTEDSLNAINFSVMDEQLSAANSTVGYARGSMEAAEANLTQIESRFAEYDNELNQSEGDLLRINATLGNASAYVGSARAGINCTDPVFLAYCLSLDSLNSTIGSASATVNDRIAKIESAKQGIAEANKTIIQFRSNIDSAMNGTLDAESRIAEMNSFVGELKGNRADAMSTISEVMASLDDTVNKSYELEAIINQSSGQINEITSRNPESVISPMLLSPNKLFGQRTFFDFLLPSLLPMILMFVSLFLSSTSLVREKNSGTLARVQLSQANPLEYCAMKVISYTVVLIPEAIMLTVIASVVYGTFSVLDFGTWVFVFETLSLLMLAFIAIGVVIAIYSESEATAFLASLVVGLPLLFLSGLLFPFEFMPSSMALLGQASPLTQAVSSMQSVMLYHSPQPIGFGILLLYAVVFTAAAAASMGKMRL